MEVWEELGEIRFTFTEKIFIFLKKHKIVFFKDKALSGLYLSFDIFSEINAEGKKIKKRKVNLFKFWVRVIRRFK